ncbi:MAG: HAMP domain-containing protein [Pirellulaceae bacterium]
MSSTNWPSLSVARRPARFDPTQIDAAGDTTPSIGLVYRRIFGAMVCASSTPSRIRNGRSSQRNHGNDFQSRLPQGDTGDELSELGASFNLLLDRQQAAMEQQRRFAGDAAHELRTPLTVLMGQIDVTCVVHVV